MIETIVEVVTSPVFLISALTISYWVNLYRKIRRGSDDYWSRREVSGVVISLTVISVAIILIGSHITSKQLYLSSIFIASLIIVFWAIGAYLENKGFKTQDNRLSAYGMVGITSIFWIAVPFFGFVFLPKTGWISLEHTLAVITITLIGIAFVDFLNIDG